MKIIYTFILFACTLSSYGQKGEITNPYQKNSLNLMTGHVVGNQVWGGFFTGTSVSLGYSRYIKRKVYVDVSLGKIDYEGEGSVFFLPKEETGRFAMNMFTLGLGYDLFQSPQFVLSAEASMLRTNHYHLIGITGEGTPTQIIEKGTSTDYTALLGLKGKYKLSKDFSIVPSLAYGMNLRIFETFWFNLGMSYSF